MSRQSQQRWLNQNRRADPSGESARRDFPADPDGPANSVLECRCRSSRSEREHGQKKFLLVSKARKQAILKRMAFPRRNEIQYPGLQNVGPGVNRIASNFIGLRLFQKPPNAPILFRFHQTISRRILDWC